MEKDRLGGLTAIEWGLIAALIAIVIIGAIQVVGNPFDRSKPSPAKATIAAITHPPAKPTIEQNYDGLQFDGNFSSAMDGIVCWLGPYPEKYVDKKGLSSQLVYVEEGDKCHPHGAHPPYAFTYDSLGVGMHIRLKMDTTGTWWARPTQARF